MPKDLMCPLGTRCQTYQTYVDCYGYDEASKNIVRGAIDGYSCRALYRENSTRPDKEKKGECALIQLLNNTDALLKLGAKGTL